jgi:UDP-N-acetylmuramoyl-L-alanyl-D-glutamate--2,6-diaminopimelate ligase
VIPLPAPRRRALHDVIADLAVAAPHVLHVGDGGLRIVGDVNAVEPITSVTHDSRRVVPGSIFCAVRGLTTDGHLFVRDAVAAGAVAVVVDHEVSDLGPHPSVVQLVVDDVRQSMGEVAAAFWGQPAASLTMVGITGTNGKTSTAHMLESILVAAGHRVGVLGTLTQSRTTPEATDLQEMLAGFRDAGTTHVVMEVTSHALVLGRVSGIVFDVAVFTNLSQDHLDFHGTMEAYFRAKAMLFEASRSKQAVVNLDDPRGRLLADSATISTVGFSLADSSNMRFDASGSAFVWRNVDVVLPMGGTFSVANALAAATAATLLGVGPETVAAGLAGVSVPGRFEPVHAGQRFTAIVDYAHTPDGLARVIAAARSIVAPGRQLIVVFGCGGDRDRAKRPLMGEIAADGADIAIVTSDNPRSEDPAAIINDVLSSMSGPDRLTVEVDRRAAIQRAVSLAGDGDVVVIAGKGHESGQTIGDVTYPFDDREVVAEAIRGAS